MARTVLPVVGAVVGFVVGGPVGAQIGFTLGNIAGNAVDPQVIKGPRIGDTQVQTSQEGVARPIVYGTAAVYGNVIDRGDLEKVITRERQGKGGGPVVESERLYLTFAIRICEGPIDGITRIWEDEKLVYDIRSDSTIVNESLAFAEGFTLYLGEESQLPDPDLEIIHGVGNTPAYRGSAYIVFKRKDVTDRRGSVPQYRFEVDRCGFAPPPTPTGDWIAWINDDQTNIAGFLLSANFGEEWSYYTADSVGITTAPSIVCGISAGGDVLFLTRDETTDGGIASNRRLIVSTTGPTVIDDSNPTLSAPVGGNRKGLATDDSVVWRSAHTGGFANNIWDSGTSDLITWTARSLGSFQTSSHLAYARTLGLLVSSWISRDYVLYSSNGGTSFTQSAAVAGANLNLLSIAASDVQIAALAPTSLANTAYSVWVSTNATTWNSTALSIPAADVPSNIFASRAGTMLISTDTGKVYRSADSGSSWSLVGDVFAGESCLDMYTDESQRWMATTSGGSIYRSSDDGLSWELCYQHSEVAPISAVCVVT